MKSLPKEVRQTIGDDIKTVQYGWPLGMPLVRSLGKGLLEVRSTIPDGIARILFNSQQDIKTALERAKRY